METTRSTIITEYFNSQISESDKANTTKLFNKAIEFKQIATWKFGTQIKDMQKAITSKHQLLATEEDLNITR